MKPPPLLLGAALLFWGWQSGLFWVGTGLAIVVELAAIIRVRWDFSNEDFERIWTLCSFLLLAMVLFAFAQNDGLSTFNSLLENNLDPRRTTLTTARTASNVMRWLPMVFFPFLIAQTYSTRDTIPLATISHILQRRWKMANRLGHRLPPSRGFNVGYPYFCMVLLAASFHSSEGYSYFFGFCVLLGWALWALRSRRYSLGVWVAIIAVAGVAGFFGQRGITQVQRYIVGINAQWISRWMRRTDDPFQTRTAIGQLGVRKNSSAIAIRLKPNESGEVPPYLREATYRRYGEGQTWFAGSSRDDFSSINEVPASATNQPYWPLVDKRTWGSVQVSCYLDGSENGLPTGMLPLPSGAARLERLMAFNMKVNSAGTVLVQGPGLLVFDAHYGYGPTYDSAPGTNTRRNNRQFDTNAPPRDFAGGPERRGEGGFRGEGRGEGRGPGGGGGGGRRFGFRPVPDEDVDVPPAEEPFVQAVLEQLQLTTNTPQREVIARLKGFFDNQFSYTMWQGVKGLKLADDETPLGHFLLKNRKGHCEYFATATVLLLRQLGIPARYATGYAVHEKSGDEYLVRFSDAHAWTLVWNKNRNTWEDFDTTPASWVETERDAMGSLLWLRDAWSRFKFELAKFRYGQSNVRKYLLWIIIPGMLLLLYQIVFRRGRKLQRQKADAEFFANWPGLDSEFYRLEKQLGDRGVIRGDAEPLGDWLRRVLETPGLGELRAPLEEVLRLHYRHRFDPHGLNAAEREALRHETSRCLNTLSAAKTA